MPFVHTAMRASIASPLCVNQARDAFNTIARDVFAVPGRVIGFNFFPTQVEKKSVLGSQLTHDIVFEVQLHADTSRIADEVLDLNAMTIAVFVKDRLLICDITASIGVGICHSYMGWASL